MSLDIPVFDLQPLRKQFRTFLLAIVVIAAVCYLIGMMGDTRNLLKTYYEAGKNRWVFFCLILVFTFSTGSLQKRQLKNILKEEDLDKRIALYPGYYKKRLILAACSFFLTSLIWILTGGMFILILLVFQFLTSIIYVPNKPLIRRELQAHEIEFLD